MTVNDQAPSPRSEPDQDTLSALDQPATTRDVPEEVTKAPLPKYDDAALAGRLVHYEREALLERDPAKRRAWQAEVARTKIEIANRKAGALNTANRVFKSHPFKR